MRKIVGLLVGLMLPSLSGSAFALGPCPGMVPVAFGYGFACVRQPPIPTPPTGARYELPQPGDAYKTRRTRERQRTQLEPVR